MRFLVTGAAGFIGFHVAQRLLAEGHDVFGLDGFTAYYDERLKRRRFAILGESPRFTGRQAMLEDAPAVAAFVADASADIVIHLAAQAGVRYSLENPRAYIDANIFGTFNLLEAVKDRCRHMLLASTSSVYGFNDQQPFNEFRSTPRPASFYAATKVAMEALAYNYAHQVQIPTTVTRLFTVFGAWGRPDMALFKFTKSIIEGSPIDVYGFGQMTRDFTHVSDVVEAIRRLAELPPADNENDAAPAAPYRVVNIGSGRPIGLEAFIAAIEAEIGRPAHRRELPMQPGDVPSTWADTTRLEALTGFRPVMPLADGIRDFVSWYRSYYAV
jgi:UDP-glucuronate 4-epimerase